MIRKHFSTSEQRKKARNVVVFVVCIPVVAAILHCVAAALEKVNLGGLAG